MRTGLLAEKVGMTRLFQEDGLAIPVTVLKVSGNRVVGQKTDEKDGYTALQIGYGERKDKHLAQAQKKQYELRGVKAPFRVKEFRVNQDNMIEVGAEIGVDHFSEGQYIDVSGLTIGKGFAGGMKRHNFGGLRASHGVSISHRSHGSTGQAQDPGKVFKGKKMAGHMGDANMTQQNLKVLQINADLGVILVKGSIPGHKGSIVRVKDSIKKPIS